MQGIIYQAGDKHYGRPCQAEPAWDGTAKAISRIGAIFANEIERYSL
jgi:hypothetical protein